MGKFLCILLFSVALPTWADNTPKNPQQAPDPGPPPEISDDQSLEQQVTIVKHDTNTVEEYRVNGRLYMMKVTPKGGVPYYLIDETGDGTLIQHDSLDTGIRPPMWVVFSW